MALQVMSPNQAGLLIGGRVASSPQALTYRPREYGSVAGANTFNQPQRSLSNRSSGGGFNIQGLINQQGQNQIAGLNDLFGAQQNQASMLRDQRIGQIGTQRQGFQQDFLRNLVSQVGFDQASQIAQSYGLSVDPSLSGQQGALAPELTRAVTGAQLTKDDIDAAMSAFQKQQEMEKTDVTEMTARGGTQVEDALRRNFQGRGALDSSFFATSLAKGIGGINEEGIRQVRAIDSAISQAQQSAISQKNKVDVDLRNAQAEIEKRKNDYVMSLRQQYDNGLLTFRQLEEQANQDASNFASEAEIEKINNLNNIRANTDSLILQYQQRREELARSMSGGSDLGSLLSMIQQNQGIGARNTQAQSQQYSFGEGGDDEFQSLLNLSSPIQVMGGNGALRMNTNNSTLGVMPPRQAGLNR